MHPRRGLRPHSPLPLNPGLYPYNRITVDPFDSNSQPHGQQVRHDIGARAAQALTSALANPYAGTHLDSNNYPSYSYTNPNYHAYFMQQRPMTTAEGYSISSTYIPTTAPVVGLSQHSIRNRRDPSSTLARTPKTSPSLSFYAHGDQKCTYKGCSFTGSKKSVETHMMDRHLIFPPGWKTKRDDWDADPSLKGKPVPVPGTGLLLNTPEAIESWLAERKKRYPSKQNIEEKKRKAQEAADRGEIDPSELTAKARKRRRVERDDGVVGPGGRNRGKLQRQGQEKFGAGLRNPGWRERGNDGTVTSKPKQTPDTTANLHLSPNKDASVRDDRSSSRDSDSDIEDASESNSDMDPAKDAISSKTYQHYLPGFMDNSDAAIHVNDSAVAADPVVTPSVINPATLAPVTSALRSPRRRPSPLPPPSQPKPASYNPFSSRPSLLRNLLLPEIRHTVSHLSQAIHFLVENDFLEGVELKPGDAEKQRIKTVG